MACTTRAACGIGAGAIALLTASFPLAFYFNRNPQSFGKLIGTWVRFRNIFEISLHVVVAAIALKWFNYYGLLYWLVAYRYLDVGPRRALQTLYNTPEKLAARQWAPTLNWVVITSIYMLAALAIYYQQVDLRRAAARCAPEHVAQMFEVILVVRAQRRHRDAVLGNGSRVHRTGPRRAADSGVARADAALRSRDDAQTAARLVDI